MARTWKELKERWSKCEGCDLCKQRQRVVLLRGTIPCDVLLIGEAPGESEDSLGRPFAGPAGKLLDDMLERAWGASPPRYAMTNLISCVPRDDLSNKIHDPPKWAIDACRGRLAETLELCNPRYIVWVGKVAEKEGPKIVEPLLPQAAITHPSAILQAHISQKGLMFQRNVVTLADVLDEL